MNVYKKSNKLQLNDRRDNTMIVEPTEGGLVDRTILGTLELWKWLPPSFPSLSLRAIIPRSTKPQQSDRRKAGGGIERRGGAASDNPLKAELRNKDGSTEQGSRTYTSMEV